MDEMREKYKEFFVTYNDENVRQFCGEELTEEAEIDMHKSLLLQIYMNMAAAYMNLNHFSLAEQVVDDSFKLSEKVSQAYLRKAQSLILRKDCTLEQAKEAERMIRKAIEMKPNEKIYSQANSNILKMLNLGDADEVYEKCLEQVLERISMKEKEYEKLAERVYERAKQINEIEKQMIAEGKIPQEKYEETAPYETSEYRILKRMKEKYVRVIDFYTEAQKPDQV